MRQLASVQEILNLKPIPGADLIEKAYILGWECVVKKGEFKKGDLCVYFEIDSILPPEPVFEFMEPRKYRVKTIKLRKQIAQGLALPIDILKDFGVVHLDKYTEGTDLTELIGVKKYDPEAQKERRKLAANPKQHPLTKKMLQYKWFRKLYFKWNIKQKGNFPKFIPKTDEDRIQSCPSLLRKHMDESFYVAEKLDGQSGTYALIEYNKFKLFKTNEFFVCSRNLRKTKNDKDNNWWEIAEKFKIEEKLKTCGYKNIAIQGEIVGPGIQSNKYKLQERDFFVFNVFDIDKQEYFPLQKKIQFCNNIGLKLVPIMKDFISFDEDTTVKSIVDMSEGFSELYKTSREGLVFRRVFNDKISFKVINPKFLLKHDE